MDSSRSSLYQTLAAVAVKKPGKGKGKKTPKTPTPSKPNKRSPKY